jgi:hypothetical protein
VCAANALERVQVRTRYTTIAIRKTSAKAGKTAEEKAAAKLAAKEARALKTAEAKAARAAKKPVRSRREGKQPLEVLPFEGVREYPPTAQSQWGLSARTKSI